MALFSRICAFYTPTLIGGNHTIYNAIENPIYKECYKKGFLLWWFVNFIPAVSLIIFQAFIIYKWDLFF